MSNKYDPRLFYEDGTPRMNVKLEGMNDEIRPRDAKEAEIERLRESYNTAVRLGSDLIATRDAEIERLKKVADQAIGNGELHLHHTGHFIECGVDGFMLSDTEAPELADYLKEKENEPKHP